MEDSSEWKKAGFDIGSSCFEENNFISAQERLQKVSPGHPLYIETQFKIGRCEEELKTIRKQLSYLRRLSVRISEEGLGSQIPDARIIDSELINSMGYDL